MAPSKKQIIVGVRPEKKLHELLISKEESQNLIDKKNFFIIKPFSSKENKNNKKKFYNFEYKSISKNIFLNINQIKKLIKK